MKLAENNEPDGFIPYCIRPCVAKRPPLEVIPVIRWKQPRDTRSIVRLVRTQLVPVSPWHHSRDGRLYNEVSQRLRHGDTLVASRSRSSEPHGFLHLVIQDETLFIDLLAVDSLYQNRRLGTELMQRAEEHGILNGCRRALLYVDESNDKAHRFYRRLGYVTVRHLEALKCYQLEKEFGWHRDGWF